MDRESGVKCKKSCAGARFPAANSVWVARSWYWWERACMQMSSNDGSPLGYLVCSLILQWQSPAPYLGLYGRGYFSSAPTTSRGILSRYLPERLPLPCQKFAGLMPATGSLYAGLDQDVHPIPCLTLVFARHWSGTPSPLAAVLALLSVGDVIWA